MANFAFQVTGAFQGEGQFAFQGASGASGATPGRIIRRGWELSKSDNELVTEAPAVDSAQQIQAQIREAASVSRKLAATQAEIVSLQARIAEEGIKRTLAEQAALERALLLAEQRQLLLAVQEAVLLEELAIIDIACVALMAMQALN